MSKVLSFSTVYPQYYPLKGQKTHFVEKYWASIGESYFDQLHQYNLDLSTGLFLPKNHTIRAGHRWKEGDMYSPRIWSGRPYFSKQIQIAPDGEIVKIWNFKIKDGCLYIDKHCSHENNLLLAQNDGLQYEDMLSWFKYPAPFDGQILCWNDKDIHY